MKDKIELAVCFTVLFWFVMNAIATELTWNFLRTHQGAEHLPWYVRWDIKGDRYAHEIIDEFGVSVWVQQMHDRLF
jgi:hypothetical protein